jgi:hypothetical protein
MPSKKNDDAVDAALELFETFQLSNIGEKPGILKSLAEVAIRRPAVLDEQKLLESTLDSRVDPSPNVRKAILDFWDTCLAEVKGIRIDQVTLGAGAVVALLADDNVSVVKRAITSLLMILRWHFASDTEGELSDVVQKGVRKIEELCQDDGSATGIKLGASKALEQAITSPTKLNTHQKAMNGMLMCYVKLMKKLKASEITGPLAVSCIRSCRSILQARPQFAGKLVPVVLALGQVEAYKNTKAAIALDECLRGFVTSGNQLAKPWARKVNDCLVGLGRDPLPNESIGKRLTEAGSKAAGSSTLGGGAAQGSSSKRARVDVPDEDKDIEARIRARIESYDADGLFDLIQNLPVDVAVEIALKTLTSMRGIPRKNTVSQDVIAVKMCNLMMEALQYPPTAINDSRKSRETEGNREINVPGKKPVIKGSTAPAPPPPVARLREFKDPLAAPTALTEDQASHQRLQALRRIMCGNGAAKARLVARLAALFPATDNAFETVVSTIMVEYEEKEGLETFNLLLLTLFLENGDANGDEDDAEVSNERYENALQIIIDGMRSGLPKTDKALTELMMEVPALPPSIVAAFADDLLQDADPSTNNVGLVICRDIVLTRPRCRQQILDLVMKACTSLNAELRSKAIRMCTNQLFSEDALQPAIEAAAAGFLKEAVEQGLEDGSNKEAVEEGKGEESDPNRNLDSDANLTVAASNPDQLTDLYCALTTKKSSLLLSLFQSYGISPSDSPIRTCLLDKCANIAGAIGPCDKNLLMIIQKPPQGSDDLMLRVLESFTTDMPGRPLVDSVLKYFEQHPDSISAIIPVLPGMPKSDAIKLIPSIIQLPETKLIEAIMRLCTVVYDEQTAPVITPAEILTLLHMVDDRKLLKNTIAAINACLGMGTLFNSEVLAASLSQLITRIPLPQLFMRTVIQSISVAPKLRGFIVDLLGQLITNQIWTNSTQWKGWIMAAQQTAPESFPVVLRLPPNALDQALSGLQKETRASVVERGLKEQLQENVITVLKKHS